MKCGKLARIFAPAHPLRKTPGGGNWCTTLRVARQHTIRHSAQRPKDYGQQSTQTACHGSGGFTATMGAQPPTDIQPSLAVLAPPSLRPVSTGSAENRLRRGPLHEKDSDGPPLGRAVAGWRPAPWRKPWSKRQGHAGVTSLQNRFIPATFRASTTKVAQAEKAGLLRWWVGSRTQRAWAPQSVAGRCAPTVSHLRGGPDGRLPRCE